MKKFYKIESEQAFNDVKDIKSVVDQIQGVFQNPNILDSDEVINLLNSIHSVTLEMQRFNTNLITYLKANLITEEQAEITKELWYKQYNEPKPKYFSDDIGLPNYDDDLPF